MAKKKVVTSNIQTNHTLGEYQRYFSHLLAKGKLNRYDLNEKNKLDPNRQYWKITDEKGKTYYYELPKYIKSGDTRTAYSLNRVAHRRPARIALAIFAGTAIVSFTSAIVTKNVFQQHFPDVPPQPVDLEGLQKELHDFTDWKEENPDGDATKEFSIDKLGHVAIATALYDPSSYHVVNEEGVYDRRPLLTVGYGGTSSMMGTIDVSVTNSFTYKDGNALEESISYSGIILPIVPKVGRRDFYTIADDTVRSNSGDAKSATTITWHDEYDKPEKSKDTYIEEVGKYPDNPFLYSVDEETVLDGSTATKTNDGYEIKMKLDTVKGVAGYVRRMAYLSGKSIEKFNKVELTFVTDSDLKLLTSEVNETYDVHDDFLGGIDTIGHLKTKFYYDDIPDIPDRTTPFDYSKYPK